MTITEKFLTSEGRIGRVSFILRLIVLAAIVAVVTHYAVGYFDHHHEEIRPLGYFVSIVTGLVCVLIGLMQSLKRLRDAGREAYLSILLLIPGVNVLFLLYLAAAPSRE